MGAKYEPTQSRVLEWRLVDDRHPLFNVWETTNTFYYDRGFDITLGVTDRVSMSPYKECFDKGIDPNKIKFIRSSEGSRQLMIFR